VIRRPALSLLVAVLVAACTGDAYGTAAPTPTASRAGTPTATPKALTVFAAASLKGALDAATTAYATTHPGVTITVSTDSSSALETQIEQGAPADVFLSADTTNPAKLATAGLASGEPVTFAGNTLVIIIPKNSLGPVTAAFDLAKAGVKVIAAGDEVPITKYATELVANLAAQPAAPGAFEAGYAANVVSKEDNVKAVVAKIELGEGDAAIVYVTDAAASGKVDTVPITPANANVPATYAGVVVKASANQAAAAEFLAWLAGPDGQVILGTFGFLPPPA